MISHLRIKNLALLESVELELPREFIAITGETGAGKSVLVGALRLLAGARAEKGIVREGAESCEVDAALQLQTPEQINALLAQAGLPECEDGQLLLFRQLSATGKPGKISINGQLSSVTVLQQLGTLWLEYNSPEAVTELYAPAEQLAILDAYAGVDLRPYKEAYRTFKAAAEKLQRAQTTDRLSADELAFLEQQLEKIDALRLSAERIEWLEGEYKRLASRDEELLTASAVSEGFASARRLQLVLNRARNLAENNKSYAELSRRLESLLIEMDDQESSWRDTALKNELSAQEREHIQGMMGAWLELKRRHTSLEGVMRYREEIVDKIQLQQNMDFFISQYEREAKLSLEVVTLEQQKLLRVRKTAAGKLIAEVLPHLKRLGLPKAQLEGRFAPTEPTPNGGVEFEFFFNANPGQTLKPLAQIASSGELARVMLSFKTVLIAASSKPVIVFDEVDANVGGEVATAVAELLHKMGRAFQVFCITHLPQVAAKANFHLLVRKDLKKHSTSVSIEAIEDERKRLEELARMLGDRGAATALEHARALMKE